MATNMPQLAEVERLSPRVIRILGGNPGKYTLQGTNTYLVGRGPQRILIDSGQGEESWPLALQRVLASENCTVSTCLITHWHPDHIKGVQDLQRLLPSVTIHKNQPDFMNHDSAAWLDILPDQRFVADPSTTLRALHSPGHTPDHMAFVLEEEGSIFAGDNVLGHGTSVFEDLAAYLKSLDAMRSAPQFTGLLYPGHGAPITDGKAKIQEYIDHRRARERQILGTMRSVPAKRWDSMDLVKIIYRDVGEELHAPANHGVQLVLWKLLEEGVVESLDDEDGEGGVRWRLVPGANL